MSTYSSQILQQNYHTGWIGLKYLSDFSYVFVLDELSSIYKIKMTYVSIQPILCIVSKDSMLALCHFDMRRLRRTLTYLLMGKRYHLP